MIKFVCASCGERLSVPDQNGGRKGVCPTCQAINRIPLKGYAETQPNFPVVARHAGKTPAGPILKGALSIPALTGRTEEPPAAAAPPEQWTPPTAAPEEFPAPTATPAAPDAPAAPMETQEPAPISSPAPDAAAAAIAPTEAPQQSLERFTSPTKVVPPPDDRAVLRSMRRSRQEAARTQGAPAAAPIKERHLPKQVRIALLILAALAIVAALYFALMFILNFALRMMQ